MRRFLFIGAHPDDPDILFGGTSLQLARAGHVVKFVSAANGNCGHYSMEKEALAKRRFLEAQASARVAGISEYQILDHPDCALEASLENREEIVRLIRKFRPDVVISHWIGDYHADHRAAGQLVMDAAYLLMVPLYCPDTPIPEKNPVFAYAYHRFTDPRAVRPDAAVEFDSVLEDKLRMLDCHVSQFYEWLPWGDLGIKDFDASGMNWEEKKQWLSRWVKRFESAADLARPLLRSVYGEKRGEKIRYAEVFEMSEYGARVSPEEFQKLFMP
ncbi:MAG: 1D-myo-inositol 2-acetamido-2-deoxy-alpha-D-glucopyranoside deacetylase [Lentisphaerae bacterium ADurb.Bin242]|nr:MAG: 1D-myo-inositol 2-acetamido-2-deoxy-alpha-D-glucopyranoside deacetylase [Lentisphaerae bacterium ADurb.Bin242]